MDKMSGLIIHQDNFTSLAAVHQVAEMFDAIPMIAVERDGVTIRGTSIGGNFSIENGWHTPADGGDLIQLLEDALKLVVLPAMVIGGAYLVYSTKEIWAPWLSLLIRAVN